MIRRLIGALFVLLLVGGCGGERIEAPKTFVVGISVQPDSFNPLTANDALATEMQEMMFLYLADFGGAPDYQFEGELAESWEFSDDELELTFHLRQDVRWHDGTPTTAHDVVFTFDRASHPDVPFPDRSKLRRFESWEALDDWTVRFVFSEASWEPIYDTRIRIVPKHLLEPIAPTGMQDCAFNRAPIGNGPWKFHEWLPEERVTLVANDDSYIGRPAFDRIVFRVVPEETTLRTELLTGGVHMYNRLPNKFYRQDVQDENLEFFRFTDRGYVYLGWNHLNPLFQDVRVRMALTHATDRQTIIDAFRDGFGQVSDTPIFLNHPDAHPDLEPLPFDPERAAQLLDEAGWKERDVDGVRMKDGQRFEFLYTVISNNEISEEIATLTQAEFGKLGIGVTSESFEWTVYLEKIRAHEFAGTVLARRGDLIFDPEDLFHSRSIGTRFNDISFGHPVTDSLIDLAKQTSDRLKRREIWWRFQEEFAQIHPITTLYVSEASYPIRRGIVSNPSMDLRGAFARMHEWLPVERTP